MRVLVMIFKVKFKLKTNLYSAIKSEDSEVLRTCENSSTGYLVFCFPVTSMYRTVAVKF